MFATFVTISLLFIIVNTVADEQNRQSMMFVEMLPKTKQEQFRNIFADEKLSESERGNKLKEFLETLDEKQRVAYEILTNALRKIKENGVRELPQLSAENQLLLKKYDELAARKKRLTTDAKHESLMKILGEEKLLEASKVAFAESLPDGVRTRFAKIHFDKSLSEPERLQQFEDVASTLPQDSKRFYDHIKWQNQKFQADREAMVMSFMQ
ncbi:unnamed protein product [Toxocara canis]|uniref:DUF148 domain-containing protein n=1 Tax=Toxocara canis TaxID=6265 RepID=A0A183UP97_TOXCA|nr:unnamed protein product [Toxocara canis]